jgi:hypothetical protein
MAAFASSANGQHGDQASGAAVGGGAIGAAVSAVSLPTPAKSLTVELHPDVLA